MKKLIAFSIAYFIIVSSAFSQVDTAKLNHSTIFDRLTKDLKEYKPDTTAVPDDKITRTIIELRNLRGGFNINEAIEYKLEEDKQKKEIPESLIQVSQGATRRSIKSSTKDSSFARLSLMFKCLGPL